MLNVSMKQQSDARTLVDQLDTAVYRFGLDHNARRLPAAVAASMAGTKMDVTDALPYLEKCLVNDPHARDLQAQIEEARMITRTLQ